MKMRLIICKLLALFMLGLGIGVATAQTTTVSVTVTDPSSQAWANGTISYVFQGNGYFNGTYQWNNAPVPANYLVPTVVTLNGSGAATFTIPTSTAISPALSTWKYVVCPNASTSCAILTIPTSGSTQNISSLVNAALSNISISATPLPRAYSDFEITIQPSQGGMYFNTITATPRYYDGSTWHNFGSGSGCTTDCVITDPAGSVLQTINGPLSAGGVYLGWNPNGSPAAALYDIFGILSIYSALGSGAYMGSSTYPYSLDYALGWDNLNNTYAHRVFLYPSAGDTTNNQLSSYTSPPPPYGSGTLATYIGNSGILHAAGGFSGSKTAGSCVLTISYGIITNVTGC